MIPLSFTLVLQALVCNAILLAWYWLALKDRMHHRFNRWYLMLILPVAWLIPMLRFDFATSIKPAAPIASALHIIQGNVEEMATATTGHTAGLSWLTLLSSLALAVSGFMLIRLIFNIVQLTVKASRAQGHTVQDAIFIPAGTSGSPYSFMRYIFWNEAIEFNSVEGQRIFRHELTHVRQKHSLDKLYLNLVLVFNWFNPFAWIISRELSLVHEYLADKGAIEQGDSSAFAGMLLSSSFPAHRSLFIQSFYQSPVKRRLSMITKTLKKRPLLSRLAVLPLFAALLFCFSFRFYPAQPILTKSITVVLDAGHGGGDQGAHAEGLVESTLNLELAGLIGKRLEQQGINVVLTRQSDASVALPDRVKIAEAAKADLFISIHTNAQPLESNEHGFEVVLPLRNLKFQEQVTSLGAQLSASLGNIFGQPVAVKQPQRGVYVLDKNDFCPALLLECGYLTNAGDRAILKDAGKKAELSSSIAQGIATYLATVK